LIIIPTIEGCGIQNATLQPVLESDIERREKPPIGPVVMEPGNVED
jgi:hypothetical protein